MRIIGILLRVINTIGLIGASISWGKMAYLTCLIDDENAQFIYCSVDSLREKVAMLSNESKSNYECLLQYDNKFVGFLGVFLLTYVLILFIKLSKKYIKPFSAHWLWLLFGVSVIYMICDWQENTIMLAVLKNKDCSFNYFFGLQLTKWIAVAVSLSGCWLIDALVLKKVWRVVRLIVSAILLILTGAFILAAIHGFKEIKSKNKKPANLKESCCAKFKNQNNEQSKIVYGHSKFHQTV